MTAIFSEILTVTLSGVPFNSARSYTGYLVSTYMSAAIIVMMLIGLLLVMVRSDELILPHSLDSIFSVMLYLCNSDLIRDVGDMSLLDTRKRNRRILDMQRTYKYGRIADLDGGMAYGIEYDSYIQQSKPDAGPQGEKLLT